MLQKLKAFIEVARQRSYTKAADSLFISQPALSKQMKTLEVELGFSLFNRTAHGVELTEKGRGMAEELEPLFGRIHQTVIHYQSHEEKIRFGSTPFLTSYYLPQFYDALKRANLHVTVVRDDSTDLLPFLDSGDIDAAIIQDLPEYKKYPSAKLFRDYFTAAVPVSSKLADQPIVTMKQCLEERQIIPTRGPLAEKMRSIMKEYDYNGDIIESQYHAMAGLVSLGMGIAYLPKMMVSQIEYRGVQFLPIDESPLTRTMYLYSRNREKLEYMKSLFMTSGKL